MKSALLIEGGGMRGFFVAGVLDALKELGIKPDCLLGVSSGALNMWCALTSQSYVDAFKMIKRPYRLFHPIDVIRMGNGLISPNLILDDLHWPTLKECPLPEAYIQVVCARTATTQYFSVNDIDGQRVKALIQASSAIPYLMPDTWIDGTHYVDGGIIQSIPTDFVQCAQITHPIYILTKADGYQRKRQRMYRPLRKWLRAYPELRQQIETRHLRYNTALDQINREARNGDAFIIRPSENLIGRTEFRWKKAIRAYEDGRVQALKSASALQHFLVH